MAQDGTANAAPAAQAPVQDGASAGAEIVVTAQFRKQNLQNTPLAITAVNSAMLEARSQENLSDIANQAPSVSLRPQSASFGPSISATIRGMGQIDFNPLVEPGVGMYIDDVYYPRLTGANFELVDVERVEVLRGPQGTLTGRNSEGGAIKYVSKKPDGTFGGFVEGTYGSRDRVNLRGAIQFPIIGDLSARVSGAYGRQDGYVQGYDYGCLHPSSGIPSQTGSSDCKTADFGNKDYYAGRVAMRYNPSSAVDIMLVGDYTHDSANNAGEVLLYANNSNPNVEAAPGIPYDSRFICGRFCNYSTTSSPGGSFVAGLIPGLQGFPIQPSTHNNRAFYEGWGVSLHTRFELSDWANLTTITAYRGFDSTFSNDTDLSPANIDAPMVDLRSRFFSHEMRVNAKFSDLLEATVGGYFSNEDTNQTTRTDIRYVAANGSPIYPLQFIGGGPVNVQSVAAFGTLFVRPAYGLTITLGGRYTDESKKTTYKRLNYDGVTPNAFVDPIGAAYGIGYVGPNYLNVGNSGTSTIVRALNGLTGGYSGARFDYRASVDYRFSPALLVYATTSTGFKGGGIAPRPFNAAQVQPFGPEKLTAYEIGVKSDLFDRRLRLNVSGYINKFKDAQLSLLSCPQFGGPGPCALPQNAGDATIKGVEAEVTASPIYGLDINGSLSYLDWTWDCAKIQVVRALQPGEANICSSDPSIVGALAAPPRGVTKWQWSVGAQYRIDMGNLGSLTPRVDVAYQGKMAGSNTVPAAGSPSALFGGVPSYTLTNARLTYRTPDENWQVSLAVTNLFDEYYFYQTFDLTGAGAGLITGAPARPREWALTVKRKF
ncbi:TonB-dependent receptor [Novosphingobium sp. ZN18A2]|uniref:TonB-dependent receptor n=1 Tax=Novosphingobium sp. ZN18A2 TaxID=3079861 RepID=UPI0030CF6333